MVFSKLFSGSFFFSWSPKYWALSKLGIGFLFFFSLCFYLESHHQVYAFRHNSHAPDSFISPWIDDYLQFCLKNASQIISFSPFPLLQPWKISKFSPFVSLSLVPLSSNPSLHGLKGHDFKMSPDYFSFYIPQFKIQFYLPIDLSLWGICLIIFPLLS